MIGSSADRRVVPGLLDRLLDDEPHSTVEPPWRESVVIRELKHSLRRDLENLLNSRRSLEDIPDGMEHLHDSLVNYGLPDLQSFELRDVHDIQRFCRLIEECVRRFEPRLRHVAVSPEGQVERPLDRTLRFVIDAVLVADPFQEPVRLSSVVEAGNSTILLEGG